jgi:hypothetical protein
MHQNCGALLGGLELRYLRTVNWRLLRCVVKAFGVVPITGGGVMKSLKMHFFHTILIKMTHFGPKRDEYVLDKIRVDIF